MRAAREANAVSGRGQTTPVRFWIISMMLVLVGLSTLKIR
jgi:UDP-N-acetylmuramyl pentapeptide phosphotransferase/UDP-N-acetylglucosamine-1-phosphate transferase